MRDMIAACPPSPFGRGGALDAAPCDTRMGNTARARM